MILTVLHWIDLCVLVTRRKSEEERISYGREEMIRVGTVNKAETWMVNMNRVTIAL